MAEIIMPKMGDAMTEGRVVKWYKNEGDAVQTGEPLVEIETDKVNLDLEAEEDGILESVDVAEGEMVPVGTPLAIIGDGTGKKRKPKADKKPGKAKVAAKQAVAPAGAAERPSKKKSKKRGLHERETAEQEFPEHGSRPKSSPLARKIAAKMGVDLEQIIGSGPRGRIIAVDVERAARELRPVDQPVRVATPPSAKPSMPTFQPLETRAVPLTAMRRTIAKRLTESTTAIPHFYLTVECDVTKLLDLRKQVIEIGGSKVSLNDFVVRATALAIHHHPYVNASFGEDEINYHGDVHVGIAVATDAGLITPVVRDADTRSVSEIGGMVRDLATRARSRKLKPDEYMGSTITISNLGMFGVEEFTAIINPPNSAILAVSAAVQKPVVEDGELVVRDIMKVTMSCDHRVIDGAAGAEFLRTFKQYLEQPLRLVM
jgi:pyruvate dehydrogenase E2 component (dihydrolipoamide acetyltransferase)